MNWYFFAFSVCIVFAFAALKFPKKAHVKWNAMAWYKFAFFFYQQNTGRDWMLKTTFVVFKSDLGCPIYSGTVRMLILFHIYVSDIAETSVEQSEKRYQDIIERAKYERFQDIFEAEFITADCTKVKLCQFHIFHIHLVKN